MLSRFFPILNKLKALKTHGRLMLHAFRHADTPKWIKGMMLGVVVYLFSPIDMVPDVLLLFGLTDDLVVISAAMWFLGKVIPEQVKNSLPNNEHHEASKDMQGKARGSTPAASTRTAKIDYTAPSRKNWVKPLGWFALALILLAALGSHPWVHAQLAAIQSFF